MTQDDLIRQAAEIIKHSKRIAVLTGAGVSKESGVPTFRDALDGLWARYDPQQLATPQAFQANPKLVWDWYEYRREMVRQAKPNAGHVALAEIQRGYPNTTLITQNVDDMHEQAGSTGVIHLHGNIARSKCFSNCRGIPTIIDLDSFAWDHTAGPPACPHCGGWVRPDVVWFGEMLPDYELHTAQTASEQCDVMLVVGTSGLVTPAATLPSVAKHAGAKIIEVNPDYSAITRIADVKLDGASGEMLPRVMEAFDD